ncbi:helix-turn-helix transcriptional regulator [Adlercreutzia sp. R21]|uniref:Helix-turn-helix transcriptional regulator n=1 Tax=Adlercreutzia wanghongyangiae TaxID=3111451 RepID=A0ABU6IIL6_9ACTN|nr:helix-turn-helix transcriptional regulator [Adlercreutzia sp. R21]MEC4176245.1 helix-turn-helix transcriptional regulator [Adlercreutzia sp. R7]MEC4184327.1 helix-turn-helix transcriptional regulator [Adlercreutzia sp. R21]
MQIISRLDRVMADRKMSVNELSERIDISPVNISRIRTGRVKAIRFSTLMKLCDELDCQPGDLLEFTRDDTVVPQRRRRTTKKDASDEA